MEGYAVKYPTLTYAFQSRDTLYFFFLLPLYGGRTSAKIKRAETLWTGEKIIRNLNT